MVTAKSWNSRSVKALAILVAWIAVSATNLLTPAHAQRPTNGARTTRPDATPTDQNVPQSGKHWLKKLADAMMGHETNGYTRNHASVLSAFRETVEWPGKCTVRIRCDDRQVALGTVIDPNGFIATKASELKESVVCELSDGTRRRAQLVGVDRGSDLALLKIPAQSLPAIRWSDQDPPSVGGWVITSGPGELPLAIGIVSVAPHRVRGAVLGIQLTESDPGPRITYVVPGSGAALAGLAANDIITHVNDKVISSSDQMVSTTSNMLPGETVHLKILRERETRRLTATLGSVADTLTSRRARFQDQLGSSLSQRRVLFPLALEHDSVLTPSQCGGVLVNLDGEAIGVNIARASRISSYAIPASVARPILESLKSRASDLAAAPVADQLPEVELTGTDVPR